MYIFESRIQDKGVETFE